jgi:flagellar biosynthesis/type III secretory pathway protein FliH
VRPCIQTPVLPRKKEKKEGRKEGRKEGKKEGRKERRKEGRKEGRKERAVIMSTVTMASHLNLASPLFSVYSIF